MARQIGLTDVTTALGFTPVSGAPLPAPNLFLASPAGASGTPSFRAIAAADLAGAPVTATGTLTARTLPARFSDMVNVKDFGAKGDGVTDDTVAIHAAAATGSRYVLFPGITKYLAAGLDDNLCRDSIFIGTGGACLAGVPTASRKSIIPLTAAAPAAPAGNVTPAKHMAVAAGKSAVTVVFAGDSHTQYEAHDVFSSPGLLELIATKLRQENPGVTFTFLNYGIGGTNLANFVMLNNDGSAGWTPGTYPTWWTDHTKSWLQTIQAASPDLVVWVRCTNEANISPLWECYSANQAMQTMGGWAKVPSNLMCVEPARSLRQGAAASNSEEQYAMFLRTFALQHNFGILDNARMGCMVRDGFDPLDGRGFLIAGVPNQAYAYPLTIPGPTRDYGVFVNDYGTAGAAAMSYAGGEYQFALSAVSGDTFRIGRDSTTGNIYYSATCAGQQTIPKTVTAIPAIYQADGTLTIEFLLSGTNVYAQINVLDPGAIIYCGPVTRFGGAFSPVVSCTAGAVTISTSFQSNSTPKPTVPQLTDTEFWGIDVSPWPTTNYYGGDSGVHPSTMCVQHVYKAVLDALNFGLPGDFNGDLTTNGRLTSTSDYLSLYGAKGRILQGHAWPGAENYLDVDSWPSGYPLYLSPDGTDANIPLNIAAKGTGTVNITSQALLGAGAPTTTAAGAALPYMPVYAGAPTGAPTDQTGFVPFAFDSVNNKIWVYTGSAWKGVVLT